MGNHAFLNKLNPSTRKHTFIIDCSQGMDISPPEVWIVHVLLKIIMGEWPGWQREACAELALQSEIPPQLRARDRNSFSVLQVTWHHGVTQARPGPSSPAGE